MTSPPAQRGRSFNLTTQIFSPLRHDFYSKKTPFSIIQRTKSGIETVLPQEVLQVHPPLDGDFDDITGHDLIII